METINRFWLCSFVVMVLILGVNGSCQKDEENPETITDRDGNVYTSITIGNQVWMVENLKTTELNDGTPIENVTDDITWYESSTPAFCWYNNEMKYKAIYGALYNWHAVNSGRLCPDGWHVPSNDEWTELVNFVGGNSVAGSKLKEVGTTHWQDTNEGATNEYGFTAMPGGFRSNGLGDAGFFSIGYSGWYWTSTEIPGFEHEGHYAAYNWQMENYRPHCLESNLWQIEGLSVRCLKNN